MNRIDFFGISNRQTSSKPVFGLCDEEDGNPAYIDEHIENQADKWIAVVQNNKSMEMAFHPIDHCLNLLRDDGTMAKRCEGVLSYNDLQNIVFVELKDRKLKPDRWLDDAIGQIEETLVFFYQNYNKEMFSKTRVWISNRQLTNQNYFQRIKDFKSKNKIVLYICKALEFPV